VDDRRQGLPLGQQLQGRQQGGIVVADLQDVVVEEVGGQPGRDLVGAQSGLRLQREVDVADVRHLREAPALAGALRLGAQVDDQPGRQVADQRDRPVVGQPPQVVRPHDAARPHPPAVRGGEAAQVAHVEQPVDDEGAHVRRTAPSARVVHAHPPDQGAETSDTDKLVPLQSGDPGGEPGHTCGLAPPSRKDRRP
jgi:hypothetical protein